MVVELLEEPQGASGGIERALIWGTLQTAGCWKVRSGDPIYVQAESVAACTSSGESQALRSVQALASLCLPVLRAAVLRAPGVCAAVTALSSVQECVRLPAD